MALSEINELAISGLSAINGISSFSEIGGISTISGGTIGPIAIAASGDDGHIISSPAAFHDAGESADGVGWFGRADGLSQLTFLRFILPSEIPNGATITNATLVVMGRDAYQWSDGNDDATVRATDSADAPAPTTAGERPTGDGGSTATTTAVAAWDNITWSTSSDNTFSGVGPVIQELVDDYSGLAAGAGIVLWLRGTIVDDKYAGLELFEHAGSTPARLTITWTS